MTHTTLQPAAAVQATVQPPAPVQAVLQPPQPVQVLLAQPGHVQATLRPPEAVVATLVVGQGPAGPSVTMETRTAAVDINAYKAVTTNGAGELIYADAGTPTHGDQVLGVSINASLAGGMVMVQSMASLTNGGWNWTPGQAIFLGLGGDLTQNPGLGTFCLSLGYAVTPTEIFIRLGRAIQRAL